MPKGSDTASRPIHNLPIHILRKMRLRVRSSSAIVGSVLGASVFFVVSLLTIVQMSSVANHATRPIAHSRGDRMS